GTDRQNSVVRLDHFARAGDDEAMFFVRDGEQRLETPQDAIAAPFLCQLDGGARKVGGKALQLLLELVEERQRVGGRARKPSDHPATAQQTHLLSVRLHDGLAHRDLSVTTKRN